ncbi:hypothetical protein CEXT_56781 [Caerostris extrusa]|uniref:Uncharacterized protein n=1 Tax=Caerostris extrusa TaxID=172846 RepID=A0AAV4TRL2_CAEEX|nr:hypothetical protein CEXT_56781 [Caerostris extrusa]
MIEYRISSATTFGRPLSSASEGWNIARSPTSGRGEGGRASPEHAYPISGEAGSDVTKGVKSGGQLDGPCTDGPFEGEEIETAMGFLLFGMRLFIACLYFLLLHRSWEVLPIHTEVK